MESSEETIYVLRCSQKELRYIMDLANETLYCTTEEPETEERAALREHIHDTSRRALYPTL